MKNARTIRQLIAATAAVFLGFAAKAAEVVIDPGVGVETNVTEKLTGATDVKVYSGKVTLNPENDFTGGVFVTNSTVYVSKLANKNTASSFGKSGPIAIESGVVKYTGPATKTDRTIGCSKRSLTNNCVQVWELANDVTANVLLTTNGFIKTGPGTLTLTGSSMVDLKTANMTFSDISSRFYLPADGTAPTRGRSGFGLYEGKVVISNDFNVTQNKNSGGREVVGGWTADNTGIEKDVEILVLNGKTTFSSVTEFGYRHGFAENTTADHPAQVYFTIDGSGAVFQQSGGNIFYMGGSAGLAGGYTKYNADLQIRVLNGGMWDHSNSGSGIYLYQRPGQAHKILVDAGTMIETYFDCGYGAVKDDTSATVDITIRNGSAWKGEQFIVNTKGIANSAPVTVKVSGGSQMLIDHMICQSGANFSIDFDDATFGNLNFVFKLVQSGTKIGLKRRTILPASITSATIGKGGLTLYCQDNGGYIRDNTYIRTLGQEIVLEKALTPSTSLEEGEKDGGVAITAQYPTNLIEFAAANAYEGPTTLKSGTLTLSGAGLIPQAGGFVAEGGTLWASAKDIAVGDFSVVSNFTFRFESGYKLVVNGEVTQAERTIISLVPAAAATDVAIITVPKARQSALEALRFSPDAGTDLKVSKLEVKEDVGGETATLYASFVAASDATGVGTIVPAATYAGSGLLGGGRYELNVDTFMKDGAVNGAYDVATFKAADQTAANQVASLVNSSYAHVPGHSQTYSAVANGDNWILRLTVADAGADGTWTKPAKGGDWAVAANWTGAIPDERGMSAVFPQAETADVPVSLGSVTLGALGFDGINTAAGGYAFSGTRLDFDSVSEPKVVVKSGKHAFAAAVNADKGLQIDSTNGTEIAFATLTGEGKVRSNIRTLSAGGQVSLGTAGFNGKLVTGSARTKVNDLSFVKASADVELGSGSLQYTGDSTEIPGMTLNPATKSMVRASVLDIANADTILTMRELVCGYGMFVKFGPGTLRFKGTGNFQANQYQGDGTTSDTGRNRNERYVAENGDAPNRGVKGLTIAEGLLVIGNKDDPADAPIVSSQHITVGYGNAPSGKPVPSARVELNNGTLESTNKGTPGGYTSDMYIGYTAGGNSTTATYELIMNGGTLRALNLQIGYSSGSKVPRYSYRQYGGTATFTSEPVSAACGTFSPSVAVAGTNDITIAGGTFTAQKSICAAGVNYAGIENKNIGAYGKLRFLGGTINVAQYVNVVSNLASTAEMELAGDAVLTADNIVQTSPYGTSIVRFNGGTYKPRGSTEANRTLSSVTHIYAGTNSTTVSTELIPSGESYTIAKAISPDPAFGEDAVGGLIKTGAQDLVLEGEMTFKGPLTVRDGKVKLKSATTSLTRLELGENATIEIPENVTLSVYLAETNGVWLAAGDYTCETEGAEGAIKIPQLTGKGVLSVRYDNPIDTRYVVDDPNESEVHSVVVSNSWVEANVPSGKALNDTAGNGFKYWKCYVLGLTPNDPNSLPIIKGVQNANPNKLAFALGNVTYNASSGVKVTYKVNEYTALNSDVFLERGSTNAGEVIEFSLPTEGILHYYRAVIEYSN